MMMLKKKAERVNISTSFVLMKQKDILSNLKVFLRMNRKCSFYLGEMII